MPRGSQHPLGEQLRIAAAGGAAERIAEQAEAEVRVLPARVAGRRRLEVAQEAQQLRLVVAGIGIARDSCGARLLGRRGRPERWVARSTQRIGASAASRSFEPRRQRALDRIVERKRAPHDRVGEEQGGEGLGDRADLEARLLGERHGRRRPSPGRRSPRCRLSTCSATRPTPCSASRAWSSAAVRSGDIAAGEARTGRRRRRRPLRPSPEAGVGARGRSRVGWRCGHRVAVRILSDRSRGVAPMQRQSPPRRRGAACFVRLPRASLPPMAGLTSNTPQPTAITVHGQSRVLEVGFATARPSAFPSS